MSLVGECMVGAFVAETCVAGRSFDEPTTTSFSSLSITMVSVVDGTDGTAGTVPSTTAEAPSVAAATVEASASDAILLKTCPAQPSVGTQLAGIALGFGFAFAFHLACGVHDCFALPVACWLLDEL